MKKIIPSLLLLIIFGCNKDYNNVIDVPISNIQVLSVSTANSFIYNSADSLITININFKFVTGLTAVYFDVYNPELIKVNSDQLELYDNGNSTNGDLTEGDNIYSNKFPMSMYYLSGEYVVKYFYKDNSGNIYQSAQQNFTYSNGQNNVAPIISNLVMPDTANFDQSITFSVQAFDSNGAGDINNVYYEFFKPDGTQIINSSGVSKFSLYDNGDTSGAGDSIANDGIFSAKLTFPSGQTAGSWTFKFRAVDRGNKFSNEISKILIVQ
ncbi:MAG TPA: hypothetical protein VKA26_13840 [Ignavibacteriaceae bacterium]|nr:hypothetical protein [Ignavibacteriaceae bacterium]